jgi:hypothetical protein
LGSSTGPESLEYYSWRLWETSVTTISYRLTIEISSTRAYSWHAGQGNGNRLNQNKASFLIIKKQTVDDTLPRQILPC